MRCLQKLLCGFVLFNLFSCAPTYDNSAEIQVREAAMRSLEREIIDLRHLINNTQVEMQIIEERLNDQQKVLTKTQKFAESGSDQLARQNEERIRQGEKNLLEMAKRTSTLIEDLQRLQEHANKTVNVLGKTHDELLSVQKRVQLQDKRIDKTVESLDLFASIMQKNINSKLKKATVYHVQKGDSLDKIAHKFNTSVDKIKASNQLSGDLIVIGQELEIPN